MEKDSSSRTYADLPPNIPESSKAASNNPHLIQASKMVF